MVGQRRRALHVVTIVALLAGMLSAVAGAALSDPPGAVRDLVAEAGRTHITLRWSAPALDGGSPVTSYRIWRDDIPYAEVNAANPTYPDRRTEPGVTYTYAVAAVNAAGQGPASSVTTTALSGPDIPREVSAKPGDEIGDVFVTWQPPAGNGGAVLRAYRVYRNAELIATVGPQVTGFRDPGLAPTEAYVYTITAANDVGEGPQSDPACSAPAPWPAAAAGLLCD